MTETKIRARRIAGEGWVTPIGAWTYSSVDDPTGVITSNADETGIIGLGDKIKLTNGGNTIYGFVTKISYSSPNTTITFLHEIDPTDNLALYLLANSAITNPYYSHAKVPFGFSSSPLSWSISKSDTTDRTIVSGTTTWSNLSTVSVDIPIGLWYVSHKSSVGIYQATAGNAQIYSTLSTANNSESDATLTDQNAVIVANYNTNALRVKNKVLELASKTTYYQNARTLVAANSLSIYSAGALPANVTCVCAYL